MSNYVRAAQEYRSAKKQSSKGSSSYHLCVEYFSQFSFDYVYISESNEDWEKDSTQR